MIHSRDLSRAILDRLAAGGRDAIPPSESRRDGPTPGAGERRARQTRQVVRIANGRKRQILERMLMD